MKIFENKGRVYRPPPLSLPPSFQTWGSPLCFMFGGGSPCCEKREGLNFAPPIQSIFDRRWMDWGGESEGGGGCTPPSLHLPPLSISPPPPRLCEGGRGLPNHPLPGPLTPTGPTRRVGWWGGGEGRRSSSLLAPRAMREEDLWRERMGCCGNWREVCYLYGPRPPSTPRITCREGGVKRGGEAAIKIIKWSLPRPPSTPRITCREGGG
nr:hypothetical protein [Morchella crassipes]